MPKTTNIHDFENLAASIAACGGVVPDRIERLLLAHQLLNAPAPAEKPETPILTAAVSGELDEKMLNKLIGPAAIAAMTAQYRAELVHRSEHTIVGQLHRALTAGCADQILDGLRDSFTAHAEQIAHARSLGINAESSPEHILASAEPGTIEAWNTLDDHIGAVSAIGAIAIRFGPRMGDFPQLREYAGAENFRLVDAAIMCCDGPIVQEAAVFKHLIVATALRHGPAPNSSCRRSSRRLRGTTDLRRRSSTASTTGTPAAGSTRKPVKCTHSPGPRIRIARRLRREQATQ